MASSNVPDETLLEWAAQSFQRLKDDAERELNENLLVPGGANWIRGGKDVPWEWFREWEVQASGPERERAEVWSRYVVQLYRILEHIKGL